MLCSFAFVHNLCLAAKWSVFVGLVDLSGLFLLDSLMKLYSDLVELIWVIFI